MNAQRWDYIENDFSNSGGSSKMKELVHFIKTSGIAFRLYGVKSLDKLIISTNNPIDAHKEAIHISFDPFTNKWHFVYFEVPYKDPEFDRKYEANKGIEKFQEFIKMISW